MMRRTYFLILIFFTSVFLGTAYSQGSSKVSVLWCDPLLNIETITSRNEIINTILKAQKAGFEAIALGVKALSGEVIYDSEIAPRLLQWQDFRVPRTIDPVKVFLEEGKRRNMQIYAVFSFFSEGHMGERQGLVYSKHPEWQTVVYAVEEEKPKLLPITKWAHGSAAFVDPTLKQVQDYEIAVLQEFLSKYTVDGIIFDKARYSGIDSDFSDHSRTAFNTFLGTNRSIDWWPQDVYELQFINDDWEIVPGQYYQEWIEFRSKTIHNFLKRATDVVHRIDPTLPIGNFVGAWYSTYYEYGVNWASESNIPDKNWASRDYYKTAIAEMFNYTIVGCFFPRVLMGESESLGAEWWMSVEGSCIVSMEVVNGVCPVYGSLLVEQFADDGERFKTSLKTILNLTNGLYIYDLSYVEKYKYWDEIESVLKASTGRN